MISSCGSDLASEHGVANDRVKQHQWKDDHPAPPEHEHETGLRRGRFVDGDDERDDVGQKDSARVPNADTKINATM